MQDTITINELNYRIKPMNAIEVLAIQSQISFSSVKQTQSFYEQVLERIEVQLKDEWLPVKEEGKAVYYPAGVENDLETIQALIGFFMKWYEEVFPISNASKNETE